MNSLRECTQWPSCHHKEVILSFLKWRHVWIAQEVSVLFVKEDYASSHARGIWASWTWLSFFRIGVHYIVFTIINRNRALAFSSLALIPN